MTRAEYPALPVRQVASEGCFVMGSLNPPQVRIDSPALQVMTDLSRIPAATIRADAAIGDANQSMIYRGVRMLFVADENHQLRGVVTANDLLGERPVLVAEQRGMRREELQVADVMTPMSRLDAIELGSVTRAEVGHVVATLKRSGRQHAIVVDRDANGRQVICGVFSASQIARQLGIALQGSEVARTFAEIEAVIAGV